MNVSRLAFSLLLVCLTASGCQSPTAAPETAAGPAEEARDPGAAEPAQTEAGAGPHGGALADWGAGKYHVEFTVDHDRKRATVYILGADEKTPSPIRPADGIVLLSINEPLFQVELRASPLDGETADAASSYVGEHESLGIVREFSGTISAKVENTPYAADFAEESSGSHDHDH